MIRKMLQIGLAVLFCTMLTLQADSKEISKVTVKEYIVKHSIELGIDPALGLSIAKLESDFCHTKKSRYGAVGVFQLMPDTARRLGYNPYYLNENIRGGLSYYKMMYQKFGTVELALAAYNAGPGNVARYKGMPPFSETRRFVSNIMTEYKTQKTNPDPVIHQVKKSAQKPQSVKPKPANQVQKPHVAQPKPAQHHSAPKQISSNPQNPVKHQDFVKQPQALNINNVPIGHAVDSSITKPMTL